MGAWQTRGNAKQYMETGALRCQLCGKGIAVEAWVVESDKNELIFCEPDCERLYYDYWVPKYDNKKETGK